ncbi:carboxyltransferase domain-containing protein [Flavobacterium sp. MC2016-06]|jgi:hypothetical protein|uniref:carboxyltransferase domain-containing protein n=1 Tax=Flavobacterium sp. MC2016-06 TaxID=2676308 RepID=UPI0012BB0A11|nr:carboxyltransferase domain-containing protein [Flavobacterium sp. MC2016-06]MBU3860996.1 hypothetical protein [Flavobacterium sp. MC2016-06]
MGCTSANFKSRKLPCFSGMGGIKAVGVAEYDSLKRLSVTGAGVTTLATTYSASTIARLELKNTTVNYLETATAGGDNRSVSVAGDLPCVFNVAKGKDLETVNLMNELLKGEVVLFLEHNDGSIKVAGSQLGALVTTGTDQTGGAISDLNGFTITFHTEEPDFSRNYVLSSTALVDYATAIKPYV